MSQFNRYRSIYSHEELMSKLRRLKHVALDMDGTIYMGATLFPYTKPFLAGVKEQGLGYSFLTNNPSSSIADYLAKLARLGVEATEEEMYTTALATIDYIKTHYPEAKRLFLLGTPSMITEFEKAGFESAADDPNDRPDVLVVAFDKSLVYERLCRAAWWISQGVPYIATNPDRVCPTDQPVVLVDCGSICACLTHATGRTPDITLGKPDPNMLSGILMIVCAGLGVLGSVWANRMAAKFARNVAEDVRSDLFRRTMTLSPAQTDAFTVPSLESRLTTDTYNIHNFINTMQRMGVRAPILLIGGLAITATLDGALTLVMIAILPFLFIAVYSLTAKGLPLYTKVQQAVDGMIRVVREDAQGIRVIKALTKQDYEYRRYDAVNRSLCDIERKTNSIMSSANPVMNFFMNLGLVCVVFVGAYRVNG